jgi:F0F1-type ATP synthase assembly protein I
LDKYIGGSALISIIGYLTAGMFNDSVNSIAPIFWILLGLGVSINIRMKSKMVN